MKYIQVNDSIKDVIEHKDFKIGIDNFCGYYIKENGTSVYKKTTLEEAVKRIKGVTS